MLRSALFRLSPRNRAIISQATNSRLCETGNNAESQAATGWPNASSDVAYRHVDCLGHCRSALTPCHSQHTPRQPFSTSQHAAQQGKDGERDAHKQAGSAEKPGAASEQGPPGDTQQGSQPVSGSDQGQADTRGSAPEQAPASGDGDTERRLREREAWKNSDGYARLSEEMKRLAGQNKLETNVRTDFGSFFGALTRPLRSLRVCDLRLCLLEAPCACAGPRAQDAARLSHKHVCKATAHLSHAGAAQRLCHEHDRPGV